MKSSEMQGRSGKPKARKRRQNTEPEMLRRYVEITSVATSTGLNVVEQKGEEPYVHCDFWVQLRGTATEPVKGVNNILICMSARETVEVGTARPASVGAVVAVKPELITIALSWPQREFDRIWNFALSGRLRFASLFLTKPRYNSGLVVNASFSSELEE